MMMSCQKRHRNPLHSMVYQCSHILHWNSYSGMYGRCHRKDSRIEGQLFPCHSHHKHLLYRFSSHSKTLCHLPYFALYLHNNWGLLFLFHQHRRYPYNNFCQLLHILFQLCNTALFRQTSKIYIHYIFYSMETPKNHLFCK